MLKRSQLSALEERIQGMTRRSIFLLAAACAFAQSANPPAFEVASVKPHRESRDFVGWFQFLPGGRFHAVNTWIEFAIEKAYDLKSYQVSGGPAWIRSERYDIEAKAGDANAGEAQMRVMLQTLLADRCQLRNSSLIATRRVYSSASAACSVSMSRRVFSAEDSR